MYVRTKVTRRLGDDSACNSLPIGPSLMCNFGNGYKNAIKWLFTDTSSAPNALPSPVPPATDAASLAYNAATGDLSQRQRSAIAEQNAQGLVKASGGKMSIQAARQQATQDVNATVPESFNWKPYAIVGGIAAGLGLALLRRR